MTDKSKILDMINNLINDKPEQAEMDSHSVIVDKMRELQSNASEQQNNSIDDDSDE